ncbi:MAG: hypothetical protein ACRELY_32805 [Polyangiaceae bacterium]
MAISDSQVGQKLLEQQGPRSAVFCGKKSPKLRRTVAGARILGGRPKICNVPPWRRSAGPKTIVRLTYSHIAQRKRSWRSLCDVSWLYGDLGAIDSGRLLDLQRFPRICGDRRWMR